MFKLLDFQAEDVLKLKAKRSCLVGNDAGTGKTYVAIALDLARRLGDGHPKAVIPPFPRTLIITPKSVVSHWDEHCMNLTEEDVYVYDADLQPKKAREKFLHEIRTAKHGGYFIMHWEALRLMPQLQKIHWFHIIADEVHRASGRKTQQTVALKKIKTEYKSGLSGTPATTKPQDLWSVLNWLWPNFYTAFWKFVDAYVDWEMTAEGYRKFKGVNENTIHLLHEQMAPWFTRRLKVDVLQDLPPKYYTRHWVTLSPTQRRAYNQMRKTMTAWVDEHEDQLSDPIIANAVVAQLVRLQQFADGYMRPLIDPKTGEQMIKWRKKYDKETGDLIDLIEVPQWEMVDPSSKIDALMELLKDRGDEQIVVFSQFKGPINLLAARLQSAGISYGLLTGDVSQSDRAAHISAFQRGEIRVFAGTIPAGGVGITLTAASTIVFIDRAWSPALNSQAEDRLHRIGQKDAVEVIDLMARDTVDLGKAQQLVLKKKHLQLLLGDQVDVEEIIKEMDDDGGFEKGVKLDFLGTGDEEGDDTEIDGDVA